jgi:predicted  nucleic acid-binding Zn-ribbon protein
MQDIQEIFNRLQEAKKKQKDIRGAYKDALLTTPGYKELAEEVKTLREKKKTMERQIREMMASEIEQLENIGIDIESDSQLITDIALTKMMKGEGIELTDDQEQKYEPVFAVKFKKVM